MADYVSTELRKLVTSRADYLCECCLIAEEDTFLGCEVDHIISLKHEGKTEADILAYACTFCNRYKGSDIASIHESGKLEHFFNPRIDYWSGHFYLNNGVIIPLTVVGEVTVDIFKFNNAERILEREALGFIGRYPNENAKKRCL